MNSRKAIVRGISNKFEAAVWQWDFLPLRGLILKAEIAFSKKVLKISKEQWIYKSENTPFTAKNIDSFPILTFFENNTFLLTEKFNTQGQSATTSASPLQAL